MACEKNMGEGGLRRSKNSHQDLFRIRKFIACLGGYSRVMMNMQVFILCIENDYQSSMREPWKDGCISVK